MFLPSKDLAVIFTGRFSPIPSGITENIRSLKEIFTEHLHYQNEAVTLHSALANILEAKVFEKNDTSTKPKKVKIIDNFGHFNIL